MDRRRAAGALLALAACIASSAAAPTASNQTALDLYEGSSEGCYYNFQHYGEGDRIMTNEPCLNCTCHNRMLMCYLRVCPFTKAIGQDCTVEKRADQCCPIVTCPDVPVDLLTSTSTTSPAEYGATGLGKLDKYGCSISGKYFPEGSKVPPTPNKPCEHCYCIRNMTTCVMQECTLHVDGCTPIYHKDVCCPVRYSCDHPEDEVPLLDDMSTTVRPTPGFLLTTTTVSPVTQMSQDCVHDDQIFSDGALIKTEKACEHCYCMKGDIVCVVQECGAPMENEGKNCTSLPPREGQCCPDTYICEGDELTTDVTTESTTDSLIEKITTLLPPRRGGVEGSGYRNEPDEALYTAMPTIESELEGSGDEQETSKPLDMIPTEDGEQFISVTTKGPIIEYHKETTTEPSLHITTDEPYSYVTTTSKPAKEEVDKHTTDEITAELKPLESYTTTRAEGITTESSESLNTVPDVIPEEDSTKSHKYAESTTSESIMKESESSTPADNETIKTISSEKEEDITIRPVTSALEHSTPSVPPAMTTAQEYSHDDKDAERTTSVNMDKYPPKSEEEKESSTPEQYATSTISIPLEENVKQTTEPDHALNTVAVSEEEKTESYISGVTSGPSSVKEEITTVPNIEQEIVSDNVVKDIEPTPNELVPTTATTLRESELNTEEPDKGLNTIPNEINEDSSSEPLFGTKTTEPSVITEKTQTEAAETKPTIISETATLVPEHMITRGDQYTVTTEPSFRKEDEISVSTKKPTELESTTVRPEFVDEGLIPTSTHDEKYATSSDVPSVEDELTTLLPEFTKKIDETIGPKHTTSESILDVSVVTESIPTKHPEPSPDQESDLVSSTEKSIETTAFVAEDIETHEGPSRIPGEGDCLLNGVTYRNNTVVPSTNNCHTGCRCASSIIKCDPIICSPPPDYMDNCQSIYDSPDSCCPTYVCDHPRETVPPQSDNQMSGTESPTPSPTIECRGDQCEISEPVKQPTVPSEPCTSDSCLTDGDHKPDLECGQEGCGDVPKRPDTSPTSEDQNKPESCANGECQLPHTIQHETKPCEGEHCEKDGRPTSTTSICENEEDCKSVVIPVVPVTPCEGESCKKVDCGSDGCDSNAILPSDHTPEVSCTDENNCKPQDIPIPECTGEGPCRRKEVSASEEKVPSECQGSHCIPKTDTNIQDVDHTTSEKPISSQEVTEKVIDQEDKPAEIPESQTSKADVMETVSTQKIQELDSYTTESPSDAIMPDEDILREKPITDDAESKKPTVIDEKLTEKSTLTYDEGTEKPAVIEQEATKKPDEDGEVKATDSQEEVTEKPSKIDDDVKGKPTLIEEEVTDIPAVIDDEGKGKPTEIDSEVTDKPTMIDDDGKGKPTLVEEEVTEKPAVIDDERKEKPTEIDEEVTHKPALIDEEDLGKPTEIDEEVTDKPGLIDDEDKVKPTVIEDQGTDKPALIDDEGKGKPTEIDEEVTDKPGLIDDEDKGKPTVIEEEVTDKPALIDDEGKGKPTEIDEEVTDKLGLIDDEDKGKPTVIEEEVTDKPALIDDEGKAKPTDIDEEITDKPTIIDDDGKGKPILIEEEVTDKPAVIDDEVKIKPTVIDEEVTDKPTMIDDDGKGKPTLIEQEVTDKPVQIDDDGKGTPTLIEEETTDKPAQIDDDGRRKSTEIDEEITKKPTIIDDDGKGKPTLIEEAVTDKPAVIDDERKEKPTEIDEEVTDKPALIDEGDKGKPTEIDEEVTDKPGLIDDEDKVKPTVIEDQVTDKPALVDDEHKGKPTEIYEEVTDKPALIDDEDKGKPTVIEEGVTDKPALIDDEGKAKPTEIGEEITDKPALIDDEGKGKPTEIDEEVTDKPGLIDDEDKGKPTVIEEEVTDKPALIDDEGKGKPTEIDEEVTDKPGLIDDEDKGKPTVIEELVTDKPALIDDEGKGKPTEIEEEVTDKPGLIDDEDKGKPTVIEEEVTDKPALIDDEGKAKPTDIDEEITDKPTIIDDDGKGKPTLIEEEVTDEPAVIDDEVKIKPTVIDEEVTDKPTMVDDDGKGKPTLIEQEVTDKPVQIDDDGKGKPTLIEEETTDKPAQIDDDGRRKSTEIDEEITKKPTMIDDDGKGKPTLIEEEVTDKPAVIVDEGKEKPTEIDEEITKKPSMIDDDGKGKPTLIEEEITEKPAVIDDEGKEKSTEIDEEITKKPAVIDDDGKGKPTLIEEEVTYKPALIDDEGKETVSVLEEMTDKPTLTDDEVKEKPTVTDQEVTEKPIVVEEVTKEPQTDMEEGSGTELPEAHITQPEKEVHPTETSKQATDSTIRDLEKVTQSPYYESSTITGEKVNDFSTETNAVGIQDHSIPESHVSVHTEPPEVKQTDAPYNTEITTQSQSEQELTTKSYLVTSPKEVITSDNEVEKETATEYANYGTTTADIEAAPTTQSPKTHSTTELEEIPTKVTKPEVIGEQEETFTDNPELELLTTKISEDGSVIIEPQEGSDADQPKLPATSAVEEETATKAYGDKIKPESESHITEDLMAVTPEYVGTPADTESQDITQVTEKDKSGQEETTMSISDVTDHIHKGTTPKEGYTAAEDAGTSQYTAKEEYSKSPASPITEEYVTGMLESSTKSAGPTDIDTQTITTEGPRTSVKEEHAETMTSDVLSTESYDHGTKDHSVTEIEQEISTKMPLLIHDLHTEQPEVQISSEIPQSLITRKQETPAGTTVSDMIKEEQDSTLGTTPFQEMTKAPEMPVSTQEAYTETPISMKDKDQEIEKQTEKVTKVPDEAVTDKQETTQEELTEKPEVVTMLSEVSTDKPIEVVTKSQAEFSETTPYLIELEEHPHKDEVLPTENVITYTTVEDSSTSSSYEDTTPKIVDYISSKTPVDEERTTVRSEVGSQITEMTTKKTLGEEIETETKETEVNIGPSEETPTEHVTSKGEKTEPVTGQMVDSEYTDDHKKYTTSAPTQGLEETTSFVVTPSIAPVSGHDIDVSTEKEITDTEKPGHLLHETSAPEDELIISTTKATTVREGEEVPTSVSDDKMVKPEEKPIGTSELPPTSTAEVQKPDPTDMQPGDKIPDPEEEFPPSGNTGYGEPDYVEEDQAFGPGTCRYGGKVYVSAQQIPRDDPCDFCFCFRSDIICLQQSCPPPIHGCHEEPIQGFCCPRYECPVSMATTVNVTTTTTTTTTTLPPHFPTHSYKGAAQRRGCQIKGHTYKVGEVVRSSSGPCLHCTCGGDGQMKCDPKACTPEPMLRQMIAAAVSAKRRR